MSCKGVNMDDSPENKNESPTSDSQEAKLPVENTPSVEQTAQPEDAAGPASSNNSQNDQAKSEESSPHHSKDTESYHDNDKNSDLAQSDNKSSLMQALTDYQADLSDDLKWKENLKLLSLDALISPPYYNLWRKESNMIYRRSVIIRKRYRRLAQKKDAK